MSTCVKILSQYSVKASTNDQLHLTVSWIRSCLYQRVSKFYQNIPQCTRVRTSFIFLIRILTSAKPRPMTSDISQYRGVKLINIYGYAFFSKIVHMVQEIEPVHFLNIDLGKALTNVKWHFSSPWARACQYQCVCKFVFKIFHTVEEIGFVWLFPNLDLDKASTNDKWHLTIPWATYCLYQCVSKILSNFLIVQKLWSIFAIWLQTNTQLHKLTTNKLTMGK